MHSTTLNQLNRTGQGGPHSWKIFPLGSDSHFLLAQWRYYLASGFYCYWWKSVTRRFEGDLYFFFATFKVFYFVFDSLYSFIMMYVSVDLLLFSLLGIWGYLSLQVGVFHQSSILNHYLLKYCLCPTFYSSGVIIRFVLDLTIPPMSLKVSFIFSFIFLFLLCLGFLQL